MPFGQKPLSCSIQRNVGGLGGPEHRGSHAPRADACTAGHWFVPVIAIAAFAFAVGTTRALRWLILTECGVPCAGQRIQVSANLVRRCG
jgi:hypothetical protein